MLDLKPAHRWRNARPFTLLSLITPSCRWRQALLPTRPAASAVLFGCRHRVVSALDNDAGESSCPPRQSTPDQRRRAEQRTRNARAEIQIGSTTLRLTPARHGRTQRVDDERVSVCATGAASTSSPRSTVREFEPNTRNAASRPTSPSARTFSASKRTGNGSIFVLSWLRVGLGGAENLSYIPGEKLVLVLCVNIERMAWKWRILFHETS